MQCLKIVFVESLEFIIFCCVDIFYFTEKFRN